MALAAYVKFHSDYARPLTDVKEVVRLAMLKYSARQPCLFDDIVDGMSVALISRGGQSLATPVKGVVRKALKSKALLVVKVGMRLEAVDRLNPNLTCVASIIKIDHLNVTIHFDGWTDKYDYVTTLDSKDLHPIGYQAFINEKLQAPKTYAGLFTWASYLKTEAATYVPFDLLTHESNAVYAGILSETVALASTMPEKPVYEKVLAVHPKHKHSLHSRDALEAKRCWKCDGCGSNPGGPRFNCNACNFDLCNDCMSTVPDFVRDALKAGHVDALWFTGEASGEEKCCLGDIVFADNTPVSAAAAVAAGVNTDSAPANDEVAQIFVKCWESVHVIATMQLSKAAINTPVNTLEILSGRFGPREQISEPWIDSVDVTAALQALTAAGLGFIKIQARTYAGVLGLEVGEGSYHNHNILIVKCRIDGVFVVKQCKYVDDFCLGTVPPEPASLPLSVAAPKKAAGTELCELCDGYFPTPVTYHMAKVHPGCTVHADGHGYNSEGKYVPGWAGTCGNGGSGGSTWYIYCIPCRTKTLALKEKEKLKEDKSKQKVVEKLAVKKVAGKCSISDAIVPTMRSVPFHAREIIAKADFLFMFNPSCRDSSVAVRPLERSANPHTVQSTGLSSSAFSLLRSSR